VKEWYKRTFPGEWPSAGNKGGTKEGRQPIRRSRSQPQRHTGVRYQQQAGYFPQNPPDFSLLRHRQDDLKCTQNDHVQQASAAIIDSRHQYGSLHDQQNGDVPQLPHGTAVDAPYQENIRQDQACGYPPQMTPTSFHSTCKQNNTQYHCHDFVPQMPPGDFESLYQLDEPFTGLSHSPIDLGNAADTGSLDGGLSLSMHDQQLNVQDNETARQPDQASHYQRSNPLQHANHQSVPQLPTDPLIIGSRNDRPCFTPKPQQLDCSFEGQHGTLQPSAKHYRTNSILDNPTSPPQCPLPPAPTMKLGVIHKGYNQKSWQPIGMNGSGMFKVDPDGFPTDHPRKRIKGQPGSETRDSITLYQLQLNVPNLAPQESPASQAMQSDTTQNPEVSHHVHPWKVSVHSDLRDSGYVSIFDSALDSMRSSISSLNLADEVNFKTDYKEADDGFVDVKVKAKWRMRRSYLDKLRDAPINGPSS
jgi:hypothetical protein